jgi:hypothetical protein
VLPRIETGTCDGYLTEEQAGDYPQGRYELNLQIAAEAGDQAQLDALFARRNSNETLRLALILLVVFLALAAVMNFVNREPGHPPPAPPPPRVTPAPLADRYPSMKQADRIKVAALLKELAKAVGMPPLPGDPTIEELLAALDKHLGTPDPRRYPGPLGPAAPRDTERQLRILMWKHDVPGWNEPGLNPVELAERLRNKLAPPKGKSEGSP